MFQETEFKGYMTKSELLHAAQPFSDKSFTVVSNLLSSGKSFLLYIFILLLCSAFVFAASLIYITNREGDGRS